MEKYPAACGKSRHRARPTCWVALVRGGTGGRLARDEQHDNDDDDDDDGVDDDDDDDDDDDAADDDDADDADDADDDFLRQAPCLASGLMTQRPEVRGLYAFWLKIVRPAGLPSRGPRSNQFAGT